MNKLIFSFLSAAVAVIRRCSFCLAVFIALIMPAETFAKTEQFCGGFSDGFVPPKPGNYVQVATRYDGTKVSCTSTKGASISVDHDSVMLLAYPNVAKCCKYANGGNDSKWKAKAIYCTSAKPANATEEPGNQCWSWKCNSGYTKDGNRCLKTLGANQGYNFEGEPVDCPQKKHSDGSSYQIVTSVDKMCVTCWNGTARPKMYITKTDTFVYGSNPCAEYKEDYVSSAYQGSASNTQNHVAAIQVSLGTTTQNEPPPPPPPPAEPSYHNNDCENSPGTCTDALSFNDLNSGECWRHAWDSSNNYQKYRECIWIIKGWLKYPCNETDKTRCFQ